MKVSVSGVRQETLLMTKIMRIGRRSEEKMAIDLQLLVRADGSSECIRMTEKPMLRHSPW